jgi:AbrB family looped-hinge helix DNA binding protein
MRVTEKGQVTIPKVIRERLGIGPGSEVRFLVDDGGVRLVGAERRLAGDVRDFDDWAERVKGRLETGGLTGTAYVDWLRGERDDRDLH